MRLQTLGGLELEGVTFSRPKPLLLLAYLALEGPKARRYLAELFWPDAAQPMNSLRVALSQLRRGVPDALSMDGPTVQVSLQTDAVEVLAALEAGNRVRAVDAYGGAFLHGFHVAELGLELEEWVYSTREWLGERVREALLGLAESDASVGDFGAGARCAERALAVPGAPAASPEDLERLYRLLVAGGSGGAESLLREAREFGLHLNLDRAAARALLFPAGLGAPSVANNLPSPPTSFVGRDPEVLELARLLADGNTRLITLTGAGGVGKSRLALQVAYGEMQGGRFADGVFFVPLETLTDPALVPGAVAEALGLSLNGSAPLDELANALAERELLLVLDNCEHLSASAELAARLVVRCPRLKILATSRERLNVVGEQLFPLSGLQVHALLDADAPHQDAPRLFLQRAKHVRRDFELTPENLPHVLAICDLVEGSPLAIELAAVWLRLLLPREVALELSRTLDFLHDAGHGRPDRQRSLRATFEHSWRLLSPPEQTLLAKLSVFRGGFTREAAREVADATIPSLAALVDKSLLRTTGGGRFERHPLVYAYTAEKLTECPDVERATRAEHARFFLTLAEHADAQTSGDAQVLALESLEREHDNLRSVLGWTLSEGDTETGLRLAVALYRFWYYHSHFAEGRRWLQLALDKGEGEPALRSKALHAAGVLATEQGDDERATEFFEARLELARELGDEVGQAASLNSLGVIAWGRRDYGRAQTLIEKSLTLRRNMGRKELLFGPHINLGLIALAREDYTGAQALFEESLSLSRELGNTMGEATALSNLGATHVDQGNAEGARVCLEEALTLYRSLGDRDGVAHCLEGFAAVATLQGSFQTAAQLAGSAEALRELIGSALNPSDASKRERRLAPARAALGVATFERAWTEGYEKNTEDAVAFVLAATRKSSEHL